MILRAGPFHPPALAAIHESAFPPEAAWSMHVIAGHMSMPGVFGFVADTHGMVLARVAADEAEILTLAVLPEARRRGVGAALMQAVVEAAAGLGAARLFLEVAETNQAAIGLYRGCGFQQVGYRPNYYANGTGAFVMELPIAP